MTICYRKLSSQMLGGLIRLINNLLTFLCIIKTKIVYESQRRQKKGSFRWICPYPQISFWPQFWKEIHYLWFLCWFVVVLQHSTCTLVHVVWFSVTNLHGQVFFAPLAHVCPPTDGLGIELDTDACRCCTLPQVYSLYFLTAYYQH